jgi:hypothetical protein
MYIMWKYMMPRRSGEAQPLADWNKHIMWKYMMPRRSSEAQPLADWNKHWDAASVKTFTLLTSIVVVNIHGGLDGSESVVSATLSISTTTLTATPFSIPST